MPLTRSTGRTLFDRSEYRVRFDHAGKVLGQSLHSPFGEHLGLAIAEGEELTIFEYIQRLENLAEDLPSRVEPRTRKLIDELEEFSISGDFKIDDDTCHVYLSGQAIRNMSGEMTFTLLFLDDTEQTRLRRLYEYMFRLANHELKSPLSCILGATEHALENLDHSNLDAVRSSLEMVDRNARSVEDMVERYLNLSRIESGLIRLHAVDVILSADVLNPISSEFHAIFREKKLRLSFDVAGAKQESHIHADPDLAGLVLRNLISNAAKYGTPGTNIRVVLHVREAEVGISVENAGPNIPEEYLSKLFQRFVRLDATRGTKGSGLGLYNARKIVELWGGTIGVESTGEVTRFTFTIPQ